MPSTDSDPFQRPVPWSTKGASSVLFTLHPPEEFPTYEEAMLRDFILRGISAIPTGAQNQDLKNEEGASAHLHARQYTRSSVGSRTTPSASSSTTALPTMATGGAFILDAPFSSLGSTRPSTPLLAHSATPVPRTMQPPPIQQLRRKETLMSLEALEATSPIGSPLPYFGYSLQAEVFVPGDWSGYTVSGRTDWSNSNWYLVASEENIVSKFRLLVDTGGGTDSWVFTNFAYDYIGKNATFGIRGDPVVNWVESIHKPRYENKSKIPCPPQDHLDDESNCGV